MISSRVVRCLQLAIAFALAACSDPEDRAAKKRIFSPEDPPKAVASAAERLPADALQREPALTRRVLAMSAAETTERLGPHKWTATVQFEWSGPRAVKLEETRTLLAGPGGVDGDFHATLENSRNHGLELIRARGDVYARSRFGQFRHRRRDRGLAERTRDDVYGVLAEVDRMLRGRIALQPAGTVEHAGRSALKYSVELAPGAAKEGRASTLAPPQYARQGLDADTQRRLRFVHRSEPQALSGEVLVDAQTSVVLKSQLTGTVHAPGEDGGTATLRLSVASEVSEIGKAPEIAAPADFLPDADKPEGVADALDRFGIPRGDAADAGLAAAPTQKVKPAEESAAPEDEG